MSIIKTLFKAASSSASRSLVQGAIPYGKMKRDGSHDHRFNCGDDRTPGQKAGDLKKGKPV